MKGLIPVDKKLTLVHDIQMPLVGENQVLIKVISASLNYGDPLFAEGIFDEYLPPAEGDNIVRTGLEFAGIVMQGGHGFSEGDKVYSYVDVFNGQLAHKEYISINPDFIAHMPKSITFDEAASIPSGGLTVLGAIRDVAKTQKDERVLINGASGGLGIFGVQIAKKIFQAEVTAVAGPGQEEFLKSLGADHVINYKEQDVTKYNQKYDVIVDLATIWMYNDIKSILSEKGRFVPADPMRNEADLKEGTEAATKTRYLMVDKGNRHDLDLYAEWIDNSIVKPALDSAYPVEKIDEALIRLAEKSKRGRVVLQIARQ